MADVITKRGAKILAEKMKAVPKEMFGTKELEKLIARMSASLRETEHGVAIAANQISLPWRIFVVRGFVMAGMERKDEGADDAPDVPFINPVVTKLSRKKLLLEEACLSVPGYHGLIKRAERATITAEDLAGKKLERGASGLLAQIFQHETDHLDGTLYVDKAEEVYEDQPEPEHDAKS
ncbi:MAG: peptide deformylase [Patescibacteria group bacterium]|nr:peptide deformylase [Patescibacteria group bacterium]